MGHTLMSICREKKALLARKNGHSRGDRPKDSGQIKSDRSDDVIFASFGDDNTLNLEDPVVTFGCDPQLNSDLLPALNLAILTSVPVEADAISTVIDASDFMFI